ncbi:MAG: endopeptidase La [Xanthomonadales bacterium]|nr:endopeptidase La [Xanthomonadales bacterium]MCE7930229.1 endopeptidase La [Xanthomonadales bacterium PRO6]
MSASTRLEFGLGERSLPILPLRDVVVYPHMVIPLFVGRERSMRALEFAMDVDKQILLVSQRAPETDDPKPAEMYEVGTQASVLQLLKLPDGTIKLLVEGQRRVAVTRVSESEGVFRAVPVEIESTLDRDPREVEVLSRTLLAQFEQLVKLNRKIPPELLSTLGAIDDPSRFADTIAAHLTIKLADKQELLETAGVGVRLEKLIAAVDGEIDVLQIEKRIRGRVKTQMEKSQREYYLNEQMKAIQKELGELDEAPSEMDELARRIEKAGMPKEVVAKARTELNRLKMMSPMSAEATVVRNYIDWLTNVPWSERSRIRKNLIEAKRVLDEDHYGLEKVKERILEYLAVQQRVKQMKAPILCLVGPPGVGKTSLGQSIARATGRKFVRMSLGGVRDEAEIRGHRRTYIGSLPGRIVQNLSKVKTKNPLFMLDELDKMSMDFRGDPSSALLEVLDPEQNHSFNDHYLEVDLDLSETMFIGTANSLNIPAPLLDRMEVIRIPGYTEDEKVAIAKKYLLPKQIKANGLKSEEISVAEGVIVDMIRYYTREAGVRNLEREISKICRKVVKELALKQGRARTKAKKAGKPLGVASMRASESGKASRAVAITPRNLDKFLGVRRFQYGQAEEKDEVALVTGLAWTEVGGDILSIEATIVPGKGKLIQTGQLGEVMQESVQAALSVVRSRSQSLGIDPEFHQKWDIHVHVPEGATPKDGPSAGIGMCTALVSALTKIPVRSAVAMTGEITLRGRVLPIGGLKEKLLAAHRGGIRTVIIPDDNRKDLADIPHNVTGDLDIRPVKWIDEVLDIALVRSPLPASEAVLPKADEASQAAVPEVAKTPGVVRH